MFCNNCGKQIEDGLKFCEGCGATQVQAGTANSFVKTLNLQAKSGLFYATVIIAAISVVLPFCKWIEVPLFNNLSSFFGGSSNVASYSLFGYIISLGNLPINRTEAVIILFLALIALIAIIFNATFIIKAFGGKANYFKYGTIGSIIMIIMSSLFIVVVGLVSAILKVISITAISWFALALAITNIVLIKKLKKENA